MSKFDPTPPEFPSDGVAEWAVDRFGPWQLLVYDDNRYRIRWVPPGVFWMGSPKYEAERWDQEDRQRVTLTEGFWLGETTVTQALWRAVMGGNPSRFKGDDLPVESVDLNSVFEFIYKLIELCDCPGLCLPTEAQWEYACRAGTDTPFSFGKTITADQVNFDGNYPYGFGPRGTYRARTVPVGSLPPNPWGLYEMHGNVWEWCRDAWSVKSNTDAKKNPVTLPEKSNSARVIRGGSWDIFGGSVRSAVRLYEAPNIKNDNLGFRFALCPNRSAIGAEN